MIVAVSVGPVTTVVMKDVFVGRVDVIVGAFEYVVFVKTKVIGDVVTVHDVETVTTEMLLGPVAVEV